MPAILLSAGNGCTYSFAGFSDAHSDSTATEPVELPQGFAINGGGAGPTNMSLGAPKG